MTIEKESSAGKFIKETIVPLCDKIGQSDVREIINGQLGSAAKWDRFFKDDKYKKNDDAKTLAAIINNKTYHYVSPESGIIRCDPIGDINKQLAEQNIPQESADIAKFAIEIAQEFIKNPSIPNPHPTSPRIDAKSVIQVGD
jgi:hypothetical protein